jgi:folate-binding protein YgfZ
MSTNLEAYQAASTGVVFLDRSDRVRIEVTGLDRAKFLHNLTTNEVKRLPAGRGVEAFVTSPQGKTLGYVTLLVGDDRIDVRTDPGGSAQLEPHLCKYGVFDDVALEDVSGRTYEYHLAGPSAEEALRRAGADLPDPGDLSHLHTAIGGAAVRVVRESPMGVPGLTVIGNRADAGDVRAALRASGAPLGLADLDPATAEALRIEAGTPVFGRDVTADNLPQEVARDDRSISFVKGCYLGQETVARIDALGHVNKLLRGLTLTGGEADVPPAGSAIEADGKPVGAVTSSAFSPGRGCPVALGYLRTAHAQPGTPVRVVAPGSSLSAVVADLAPRAD